jgi:hypothetical protein
MTLFFSSGYDGSSKDLGDTSSLVKHSTKNARCYIVYAILITAAS